MRDTTFNVDELVEDLLARAARVGMNKQELCRRAGMSEITMRRWQQKTSSGKCHFCEKKSAFKDLTMDHLVPLSRGGRSTKDNLVPCCKTCNNKKKSMLPLEWEAYIEENLR